jgi:hypothetical protein
MSKSTVAIKLPTATRESLRLFLFPTDRGQWLSFLRIGLAFQVAAFTWSFRRDWMSFFEGDQNGSLLRRLSDAIVSSQNELTPHLGWLVAISRSLGGNEHDMIQIVWFLLLASAGLLLSGLFCRSAALLAWFLYLCTAKSSLLSSYGVDNFTIIGLFYLMVAPLPDRWSLDWRWRKRPVIDPQRIGFHRRVLQLHLCLIYFFAGVSKMLSVDWWNGNSVWRALTRPPFDLIPPNLLIRFAGLLTLAGILVWVLETGYPGFIWGKRTRLPWLIAVLVMHLSIGLTMGLYLFALIMIVLNLAAFGPGLVCHRGTDSVRPTAVSLS